ncbi:MAG: hypothetical protein BHW34_03740 [Firmicutes bacterium CAG:176_59_8]|nr:MAG: hypothetical protein BHW34_03740 [Firmicutes bacterium CAG:176_59_8]
MNDVIVLGGGASGMAAALTLLTTGNGRCNLTNEHAGPDHYHGERPEFCRYALEQYPAAETLAWFAAMGLETVTESDGRVYPRTNTANSVLDVLRAALARYESLTLLTGDPVSAVKHKNDVFTCALESGAAVQSSRLVLACGGAAGSKVGGVTDGYRFAKALGHHRTALYPALVQIKTDPAYPRALKGVKAEALLTLRRGREALAARKGELLFTEYGVSGPAVFDLSRAASCGGEGLTLALDLWPERTETEVLAWLRARRENSPALPGEQVFVGALHNRLGQMTVKYAAVTRRETCGGYTEDELTALARACKGFALPVTGVCGFDQAQVTAGGLCTDEFDPETMKSRLVSGLYACGELLDVDGDCGGFNPQWGRASGRLAGRLR